MKEDIFKQALKLLASLQTADPASLEILYFIAAEGGVLLKEELIGVIERELKQDANALLKILRKDQLISVSRLTIKGKSQATIALADHLELLIKLPSFYRNRLRHLLRKEETARLKSMARDFYEINLPVWNHHLILQSFAQVLLNPKLFEKLLTKNFDLTSRKILKILAMFKGGMPLWQLNKQLKYFDENLSTDDLLDCLQDIYLRSGLVFSADDNQSILKTGYAASDVRIELVQDAVYPIKYNFKLETAPWQTCPTVKRPIEPETWKIQSAGMALFQNFMMLLNHFIHNAIPTIQKGGVHKAEIKKICSSFPSMSEEDYAYYDFLFSFAESAEVITIVNDLWNVDYKRATRLLKYPGQMFRLLFNHYFKLKGVRKLSTLQDLENRGDSHLDPLWLVWIMSFLKEGCWVGVDYLAFLLARLDFRQSLEEQEQVLTNLIGYLVEKPLFWLGVVDLTRNPEDGALQCRLTQAGARLLHENANTFPEFQWDQQVELIVQSNYEIFIPAAFSLAHVLQLSRFTEYNNGTYKLTHNAISRGLDDGLVQSDIIDFITEHSRQEIPQNVLFLIEETARNHGHILVDGDLFCMRTTNGLLMRELEVQGRVSHNFLLPVNDQLMLLKPDSRLEKMVAEMRRLGYLPRLYSAEAGLETSGSVGSLLSTQEIHQILALYKAYELSDGINQGLTKHLSILDSNLPLALRQRMAEIDDILVNNAADNLAAFNQQYSKKEKASS
ncbi:MAG: helicase-associated domain-containing protein [Candidatus Delongbacteria bacterium]|nr:helicase-associated domain-containing protein [Candidatus Delongbacteria bacterium]